MSVGAATRKFRECANGTVIAADYLVHIFVDSPSWCGMRGGASVTCYGDIIYEATTLMWSWEGGYRCYDALFVLNASNAALLIASVSHHHV